MLQTPKDSYNNGVRLSEASHTAHSDQTTLLSMLHLLHVFIFGCPT